MCDRLENFYAHSLKDRPPSEWEPLAVHLEAVATRAAEFASVFGGGEWARLAGRWHDLGKYSAAFQAYLRETSGADRESSVRRGPDHSTAGAQHAVARCSNVVGRILAYCIAGHHGGLPDATDAKRGGESGLNDRLTKPIDAFGKAPGEFLDAPNLPVPALEWGTSPSDLAFRQSVLCRMLFSCLVDADFLATEQFMQPDRAAQRPGEGPTMAELLAHLDIHLAKLEAESEPSPVNGHRAAVLAACREKSALPPGLFSLTVPTGGGKTLSSLAFGLAHAVRHDLRRVIYAIPFTSIIEQNAKVFRDALAAAGDNVVLEHHSNFECKTPIDEKADGRPAYWDSLASENWDAPIVVTTNVQLFESLFANRTSRCRKLHRIAKSVIILDEVQTLPVELLRPTLAMLDELCRNYGCTVVLCSATQPAVDLRDGFSIGLDNVREIIDDAPALFTALKRVEVERIGLVEDKNLAARMAQHPQVLCVVSTRKHAADLFHLVKSEVAAGVFHLSASMCAAHRSDVLNKIRVRLNPNDPKPCMVVSTQLVEAGVDIDFPVVYRAMTGIDSIAQAAGRCNREGRWNLGQVYVFDTDVNPRGDLRNRREMGSEVASIHRDFLSLDAVEEYFRLLYWSRHDEWDKHDVLGCFSHSKRGLRAQFREAASRYRLINDDQQPVIVPYGDAGKALIDELKAKYELRGREFSRRAQRFTVNVRPWRLEKLRDATLVALYHERYWVLEDPTAYDKELGLRTDVIDRNPESLMA